MKWSIVAGLAVLASLCLHYWVYPPVEVSEEIYDQFCLKCGNTRSLKIYAREGSPREEEEKPLSPNYLASYTAAIYGPCQKHEWASYHGGGTKYTSGLAYFFSMKENSLSSGNSRAAVPAGGTYCFKSLQPAFDYLYKNDREALKRILDYIFARIRMNRWEKINDFTELIQTDFRNATALSQGLTELEKEQ